MAGTGKARLRDGEVLLRVEDLVVEFPAGKHAKVHAVSGISFDVREGETLGLVGESGCGKSTTGRAIMQLPRPTSGSVVLDGEELTTLEGEELRRKRTKLQMIFQDPISSLNPRRKVHDIVGEGLSIWKDEIPGNATERVDEVIRAVGLDPLAARSRRANEYSGGQCQRVCVARALVLDPQMLICDEPVSALDVSVQAQLLNLLEDMKARYGLTMVFIAHDLAVVKNISDRVIVMYLGKICEVGDPDTLFEAPAHPYTSSLMAAIPSPNPRAEISEHTIQGDLPSPLDPPSGCRFRTRCPKAADICASEEPQIRAVSDNHYVACHFPN